VVTILDVILVAAWAGSLSWIRHDARRRLRTAAQVRLALASGLVFPVGGLLLYLLLRPPELLLDRRERRVFRRLIEEELGLAERCYACRAEVRPDFVCCPGCGEKLSERCRSCSEPLRLHWRICPRCKTPVKKQVGLAA
jgi:hypothetical protein